MTHVWEQAARLRYWGPSGAVNPHCLYFFCLFKTVPTAKCVFDGKRVNEFETGEETQYCTGFSSFPWVYGTPDSIDNLAFRYETSACQNTR